MSSLSQDEIIEMSNPSSPSSFDNSSLEPFNPAFEPRAVSASSKTTRNLTASQGSSSNSNKRYQSKFRKEWLSNPLFSTFLRECKSDSRKALCITCNVQFSIQNSGLGDINHHIQTKRHRERARSAEVNPSKRLDAAYKVTTTELNRLSAVEGSMVFHSVKHSHSYISQACAIDVIKKCFSDSSTAKNVTCDKTKAREIACNVLAPSLTDALVHELRSVAYFSVCYDASNKGNAKMLPIAVQFFSKFGVKRGILDFIEQSDESANALFENIKYVLDANELRLDQLVSLGSDNTNVNVGNHHSVFTLFEKLSPHLIKGTCYSHVFHNSVKHANEHLLFDIEAALLKIYSHFCRSSNRSQELKDYFDFVEQEQKVILKHIKLRWLSLHQSIERLIDIHPIIKSYFLNLENNQCPSLLLEFFTSCKSECTLYFLANILPEVQHANLLLQRNHTTGVSLHGIVATLLRKLKNRLRDDFFGCKVSELLQDYPIKEVNHLQSSFRLFIRSVIEYIEKYYDKYKSLYESISIFDEIDIEKIEWRSIQQCSKFIADQPIDQDDLYDEFNHVKSKHIDLKKKFGGISDQVQSFLTSNLSASKYCEKSVNNQSSLCNDSDVQDDLDDEEESNDDGYQVKFYKHKKTNKSIQSDHLWAYLIDGERVPNLRKLIEFVFAIPASNAYCESIFSHMNYLWNDNRNRMKHELVAAELKIKLNTDFTCTDFYDYLLTNPELLKQIRSSDKYSHVAKAKRIA